MAPTAIGESDVRVSSSSAQSNTNFLSFRFFCGNAKVAVSHCGEVGLGHGGTYVEADSVRASFGALREGSGTGVSAELADVADEDHLICMWASGNIFKVVPVLLGSLRVGAMVVLASRVPSAIATILLWVAVAISVSATEKNQRVRRNTETMLYVEYYYTMAHALFLVRVDGLLLLRALTSPFLSSRSCCSLSSTARLAIASFTRSSLERNLGYKTCISTQTARRSQYHLCSCLLFCNRDSIDNGSVLPAIVVGAVNYRSP